VFYEGLDKLFTVSLLLLLLLTSGVLKYIFDNVLNFILREIDLEKKKTVL
jgi:hypothetical protein